MYAAPRLNCGLSVSLSISLNYPEKFKIHCPKCGSCATFQIPFTLCASEEEAKNLVAHEPGSIIQPLWARGNVTSKRVNPPVVVHNKRLFPWKPVSGGFSFAVEWGICTCITCKRKFQHKLSWPKDAYYIYNIRGNTLWLLSTEHASALHSYIKAENRPRMLKDCPTPYNYLLTHTPKYFLLKKNRQTVLKKLNQIIKTASE